jgi:predicted metalloprotease with PDZ domain
MKERPGPAEALFDRGLAFDERGAPPTYFYTLFKTNDGQMRAFVRPGGPAWVAGLRTNDIVVKLDGKFWWEYGTFQTQRRAYDGLPHTFVVTTGINGPERTVALGLPFPAPQ